MVLNSVARKMRVFADHLVFAFSSTLLLSAVLLFSVQPMFGKIILPELGGTASVWNTCMVFYQLLLLAGYIYAHLLTTKLGLKKQFAVHFVVVFAAFVFLPVGLGPDVSGVTASSAPALWLIKTLFLAVGAPFFVVSTTAPLLQRWFSYADHKHSQDPYFLYAASNVGSMAALLGYPLVVEPVLPLSSQTGLWSNGFVILGMALAGCALLLLKNSTRSSQDATLSVTAETDKQPKEIWQQRIRWLLLAFCPSALMLGVTAHIATDLASVPFVWIVPLALYLLTFILVFSIKGGAIHRIIVPMHLVAVLFFPVLWVEESVLTLWAIVPHLVVFFLCAMLCHGEMAKSRPNVTRLTEFYLFMSLGGALGGIFSALVAPAVFSLPYEYPLLVMFSLALRSVGQPLFARTAMSWLLDIGLPVFVLLAGYGLLVFARANGIYIAGIFAGLAGLVAALCFAVRKRPVMLSGLSGAVLVFCLMNSGYIGLESLQTTELFLTRNFFGVVSVRDQPAPENKQSDDLYRVMLHGTTNHGAQALQKRFRAEPLMYYNRKGPLGAFFDVMEEDLKTADIGVVGLGVGTVATYAQPGQNWVYYEINPAVIDVADKSGLFTYLQNSKAPYQLKLGDARLLLEQEPDNSFDVLMLDAYNSDSIPIHLMTKEAFGLYLRKLRPNGILLYHLSNRYFNLKKVIKSQANDAGLSMLFIEHKNTATAVGKTTRQNRRYRHSKKSPGYISQSSWAVISSDKNALEKLQKDGWQPTDKLEQADLWTDDFSNIFTTLRW